MKRGARIYVWNLSLWDINNLTSCGCAIGCCYDNTKVSLPLAWKSWCIAVWSFACSPINSSSVSSRKAFPLILWHLNSSIDSFPTSSFRFESNHVWSWSQENAKISPLVVIFSSPRFQIIYWSSVAAGCTKFCGSCLVGLVPSLPARSCLWARSRAYEVSRVRKRDFAARTWQRARARIILCDMRYAPYACHARAGRAPGARPLPAGCGLGTRLGYAHMRTV